MKNRYEVTNGVHESNAEILKMRTLSYCCQIGCNEDTERIVKNMGYNVDLPNWYDFDPVCHALEQKYNMTNFEVRG